MNGYRVFVWMCIESILLIGLKPIPIIHLMPSFRLIAIVKVLAYAEDKGNNTADLLDKTGQ